MGDAKKKKLRKKRLRRELGKVAEESGHHKQEQRQKGKKRD